MLAPEDEDFTFNGLIQYNDGLIGEIRYRPGGSSFVLEDGTSGIKKEIKIRDGYQTKKTDEGYVLIPAY